MWTSTAHRRSTSEVREHSGISIFVIPAGNCRSDRVPCHSVEPEALLLGCPGKRSCGVLYGLGGTLLSQDRPSLVRGGKYDRRAPELSGTSLVFAVLHAPVSARRARSRSRQFDVVVAANSTLGKGVSHGTSMRLHNLGPPVWRASQGTWD